MESQMAEVSAISIQISTVLTPGTSEVTCAVKLTQTIGCLVSFVMFEIWALNVGFCTQRWRSFIAVNQMFLYGPRLLTFYSQQMQRHSTASIHAKFVIRERSNATDGSLAQHVGKEMSSVCILPQHLQDGESALMRKTFSPNCGDTRNT